MTDRFERKMEARFERRQFRRSGKGNLIAGAFIIFAGLVWLASTSDMFYIPNWIISWPMILIAFGLLNGIRHGFGSRDIFFDLGAVQNKIPAVAPWAEDHE